MQACIHIYTYIYIYLFHLYSVCFYMYPCLYVCMHACPYMHEFHYTNLESCLPSAWGMRVLLSISGIPTCPLIYRYVTHYIYTHTYELLCVHVYTYIHVYIHYIHIYICMYICMYVCISMGLYV